MTLEEMVREMRETLAVTSTMSLRHQTIAKEHAECLRDQERILQKPAEWQEQYERRMRELREEEAERGRAVDARIDKLGERIDSIAKADAERGRVLDARIAELVSAVGEMLRRDAANRPTP
jgi:uncharacterized membrane-anchored protein YjiN (DUF445 family)